MINPNRGAHQSLRRNFHQANFRHSEMEGARGGDGRKCGVLRRDTFKVRYFSLFRWQCGRGARCAPRKQR